MINNAKNNNIKTNIETIVSNGFYKRKNIFNFTFYQIDCSNQKQLAIIFHCWHTVITIDKPIRIGYNYSNEHSKNTHVKHAVNILPFLYYNQSNDKGIS